MVTSSTAGWVTTHIEPDQHPWFTELDANRLGRITHHRRIVEVAIPTRVSQPRGLAVGSDGDLCFVGQAGNRLGRWRPGDIQQCTTRVDPAGAEARLFRCALPLSDIEVTHFDRPPMLVLP
jgi:streptogramin lyase